MRVPSPKSLASAADHAACRAAIRSGSRSFHTASLLLPPAVRRSAYGLYAFCRLSDDAVDDARDRDARRAAYGRLSDRLGHAYAGRPFDAPADRALCDIVLQHAIPEALPRALLEGFAWDAEGRRYATLGELGAYAARVAGSVGAMMSLVMGVRDPVALARACDLGIAMQFTNIARDVGEDARAGRLYLPLEWLAESDIDPDRFLARPEATPAVRMLVGRLLAAADVLYRRAEPGIAALPAACRPSIRAARLIYDEIGRRIEANGLDSVGPRARVPALRKAMLLTLAGMTAGRADTGEPALPEAAFLIEAIAEHPLAAAPQRLPAWWNVTGQIVHVLDLIEALEEREALRRSTAS